MSEYSSSAGLMWPATFPGSEKIDGAHVTVVYLGEVSDIRATPNLLLLALDGLHETVGDVSVVGTEVFGGGEHDKVWVALLDDKGIGPWREDIKSQLEACGIKDASSFPDYKPHVTLGPYTEGSKAPKVPETVHLGRLEVWWGDKHVK